ncbi:glycosyltransferase family 4 protein [Roseateles sp. BYS180W]|uniref:Glycosyltransferase family 4 protein n=1 Tax=Roseateles rivi TaxID=3299028 RepID=A0ABW7FZ74_9BURK
MKTLCIEGWRGVNHSIAMVNQNQILEMVKYPQWHISHRDAPYFMPHWSRDTLGAGFAPHEAAIIDGLPPPPEAEAVDVCLRIASPLRASSPGTARRTVTFAVTEFGLSDKSFDPPGMNPRLLTQGDDWVLTPTQWSKARLVDCGFDEQRVRVVPHGYKTDTFFPLSEGERQAARAALGLAPHEVVFTNVGVATWNKGLDLLILAFAELRMRGVPARLILKDHKGLYGLGVEQTFAELAQVAPQVVSDTVREGISVLSSSLNLGQLRSLYALSDAYVSPYRAEGFNLPVLEAMGCGTWCIVSGGGATDDFTPPALSYRLRSRPGTHEDQPQVQGQFVVPDFEDLVHAMTQVALRKLPTPEQRQAARTSLAEHYSWAAVTRQLMEHLSL